jgi:hypothetical protein
MLHMFGFERAAVLVSDLYFIDPNPLPGQESPERGVRLEVRLLDRGELHGSIYSAQPIGVGQPVWRADLLESVDSPGSLNRAHHHPQFSERWDPGHRVFEKAMLADPPRWVGDQLADLEGIVKRAGLAVDDALARDAVSVRGAAAEIMATVARLLAGVAAGELAVAPTGEPDSPPLVSARVGWL